jgi:hypothetical protein
MLGEDTKITLRSAITVLIFLGGLVWGYQVTIGSINARLSVLEKADTEKADRLKRMDEKLDRLLELSLGRAK